MVFKLLQPSECVRHKLQVNTALTTLVVPFLFALVRVL
jgi:hypothetical protein